MTEPFTSKQLEHARKTIKRHYQLRRLPNDREVHAEIRNLQRKRGDYDDRDEMLAAALKTGQHPMEIE